MRSTPEQDEQLRLRLQAAVDQFAGGSADKFGQMVGYANGGYVRECLKMKKPVREALIDRVHATSGMQGWFSAFLTPIAAADIAGTEEQALIAAFRALPAGSPGRRELLAIARGIAIGSQSGGAITEQPQHNLPSQRAA